MEFMSIDKSEICEVFPLAKVVARGWGMMEWVNKKLGS